MIQASLKDQQLVVQILCASFDTNKSINYIAKQDSKREERIRVLMEYSFEIALKFGEVYISENKQAAALILFPEKRKTDLAVMLMDLKLALKCIGIWSIGRVLEKEKKTKACHPSKPIAHLWFLGVLPSAQGQGIGKKMLSDIVERANELQRPVYLETSMVQNLPFYKTMGFEIYQEIDISYVIYLLKREIF